MAKKKNEIAASGEDAQVTVDRIVALNKQIDLELPQQTDELWHYVARMENEAAVNMAKRGLAYLMLKQQLPHGEFLTGLEQRDIHPRAAQRAIRVAQMLMALPKSKTTTLSHLSGSKLIELAKIPADTIEELSEQGELDIDELDQMSVRELKQHIRKLREVDQRKDLTLQKQHHEIKQLKATPASKPGMNPQVQMVRAESTIMTDQAMRCIDELKDLAWTVINPMYQHNEHGIAEPIDGPAKRSACEVVWFNLMNIQAKVHEAIKFFHHNNASFEFDEESHPLLSFEETNRILAMREVMLGEHQAGKEARQRVRDKQTKSASDRPVTKKKAAKKKAVKKKATRK